jgi:ubiquinol-cytochrome c reductase cytochrome b subunit
MLFAADFVMLNYLGLQPPTGLGTALSRIGTVYYFAFFLGLTVFHRFEKSKPVPERVTS